MPRIVKGPDGKVHSFPDAATDAMISAALGAVPDTNKAAVPSAKTWMPATGRGTQYVQPSVDTVVSALPTVGGMVGGRTAGPAGAGLGGAIGESARQVINTVRGTQAPMGPSEALSGIGTQAAIQAGSQYGGELIGKGMKAAAPWMMQKVLRPSYALLEEYRTSAPKMAEVLLDAGINVTEGGLAKLQGLLRQNNTEIRSALQNAPGTISKKNVSAYALPTAAKIGKQTNPTDGLNVVADTVDEFRNHPIYKGDLSPIEAHDMKVATYQKLGNQYGEMKGAAIETEKALARGLKEEVVAAVPSISAKNARNAELMGAGEAVAKRVAADANADPIGLLWASHSPQTFIAGLIHKQPVLRSMLANGMWANAARVAKVAPDVLRSAIYAIASQSHAEDEK